MSYMDAAIPALSSTFIPPMVLGTADLTSFAYQGNDYDALMERIHAFAAHNPHAAGEAAWAYDTAIAAQLGFRRAEGLNLQDVALATSQIYRIAGSEERDFDRQSVRYATGRDEGAFGFRSRSWMAGSGPAIARGRMLTPISTNADGRQPSTRDRVAIRSPLRLLALAGPGDLMTNTPLDFLTGHLDIRLDILYILPDRPLPAIIPDHDIAFFTAGEADAATLSRLRRLFASWPRPALNDPGYLPALERDTLSRSLAGIPGLCSPAAIAVSRADLESGRPIPGFDPPAGPYPYLIRPLGSHAGANLCRIQSPAELSDYLRFSFNRHFFLTAFEDYSGPDGLYRKSRIAFFDRRPFLCHMAISGHWMVHYLNAGMTESAEKRDGEARAMAEFDAGFARRHAAAFDALHARLGFDYYSIDCAETRDGRLLVFEADSAAIVHMMDPPDLFPYKPPQMRKVFAAFEAMLRRRIDHADSVARFGSIGIASRGSSARLVPAG